MKNILHDLSLKLDSEELAVVLGPNGAGKTTLFRAALGLLKSTGNISIDGQKLSSLQPRERAALLAYLPQDAPWLEPVTVLDAVVSARFRFSEPLSLSREMALKALAQTNTEKFSKRSMISLSGGERQRVHMAAALAQDTPWLLLDEPANPLDPAQQRDICQLIQTIQSGGKGVMAVIHDINILRWFGDSNIRIIGIDQGRIAFDSRYNDGSLADKLSSLFGISFGKAIVDGQTLFLAKGDA
ncbi:MAG: ABC transporter ATP-binding protein [Planctomycetes bacterium]|nr:ABC transporter ATP-binding protein [Planctomycetota bacterium]